MALGVLCWKSAYIRVLTEKLLQVFIINSTHETGGQGLNLDFLSFYLEISSENAYSKLIYDLHRTRHCHAYWVSQHDIDSQLSILTHCTCPKMLLICYGTYHGGCSKNMSLIGLPLVRIDLTSILWFGVYIGINTFTLPVGRLVNNCPWMRSSGQHNCRVMLKFEKGKFTTPLFQNWILTLI